MIKVTKRFIGVVSKNSSLSINKIPQIPEIWNNQIRPTDILAVLVTGVR
jgi:hypothetical protein